MHYVSTRNPDTRLSAAQAIVQGLSRDGGLFLPEEIPQISLEDIKALSLLPYPARAAKLMKLYLDEFTEEELLRFAEKAYGAAKFDDPKAAPVKPLGENRYILELWHGPTAAFKDMALQIMPRLLSRALVKTGETRHALILVATSGDTGKAALEGYRNVDRVKIMVFYPVDGVSRVQKLQMATQTGDNLRVVAIKGNFDDAQSGVKKIFTDREVEQKLDENKMMFSSANSINWGRLAPQIVYYVYSYVKLVDDEQIKLGDKINICVPTGNFGNILAAYYAKMMGIPVNKLICASNSNNVLTDFINTGVYDRNRKFYTTISPSMDILISSNLERLLFMLSGGDDEYIKKIYAELADTGRFEVTSDIKSKISEVFSAGFCTEEETKNAIKTVYEKYSYTMDTHTAVAYKVYDKYAEQTSDKTKTVIASTASPYKFSAAVLDALGAAPTNSDEFALTDQLEKVSAMPVPNALSSLKSKSVRFDKVIDKSEMKDAVYSFLGIKD